MQSRATTVSAYLKELPADRRKALSKLRAVIRKAAPKAIEEMLYGMVAYTIGEPVLALASQKNFTSATPMSSESTVLRSASSTAARAASGSSVWRICRSTS